MFNPKVSGIFAGAGFVLSLLVGLFSGAQFPLLLIRAFIFAAVFFALSGAGYAAIQRYLPELLSGDSQDIPALGGQVDISVGDDDAAEGISLESGGLGDDTDKFLENPGDSGGDTLDQIGEGVYTGEGNAEEIRESSQPALPGDLDFSSGEAETVDMLPDLDAMSGAFNSSSGEDRESAGMGSPASSFGGSGGTDRAPNNKGIDENFNVQEMASAIQTILKRENKG